MKFLLACLTLSLALGNVFAAPLSQADREALLDDLEKIREAANTRVDERYRMALNAFRGAMSSSEKAFELYLDCVEKVDFEEQQKTNQEFREWKRNEEEHLSRPAFHSALRYQLSWLVLTLQAHSKNPDRTKLIADAASTASAVFADAKELAKEQKTLAEEVTATAFARAYKVSHAKPEKWPLSPIAIEPIFNDVLLPPLRNSERLPALRDTWLRRIQFETIKREFWSEGSDDEKHQSTSGPGPETTKFLTDERPKLLWEMEKDLFKFGDESGAAVRMLAHIQAHLTHPSARAWAEELKVLLAPEAPASSAAQAP